MDKLDELTPEKLMRIAEQATGPKGYGITPAFSEALDKYVLSKQTALLEELLNSAGWYSQHFTDKARKVGIEDTLIPVSAISDKLAKIKGEK